MKYHHFDIAPIKITEILWNSEEIRWKFDKDLQNLLYLLQFSENCVKFCEKWCKGPEKTETSGMVQRKKCRSWKTLKNATLDAKIGVDTAENEPSKVSAEKSEKSSVSNFPSKHLGIRRARRPGRKQQARPLALRLSSVSDPTSSIRSRFVLHFISLTVVFALLKLASRREKASPRKKEEDGRACSNFKREDT